MVESTKWIATIPTPSLANIGKINIASDLLAPYSDLMTYFLSDIDLRFVRDNEYSPFAKAKPYQTKEDYIQKPTQPRSLPISIGRGIGEQRGKINVGYLP